MFPPQLVLSDLRWGGAAEVVCLSAVFMAVTLVVFSVYGVFAAAVRRQVFPRRIVAWVRRSFAATTRACRQAGGADAKPVTCWSVARNRAPTSAASITATRIEPQAFETPADRCSVAAPATHSRALYRGTATGAALRAAVERQRVVQAAQRHEYRAQ